jgi:hypothetical protein
MQYPVLSLKIDEKRCILGGSSTAFAMQSKFFKYLVAPLPAPTSSSYEKFAWS